MWALLGSLWKMGGREEGKGREGRRAGGVQPAGEGGLAERWKRQGSRGKREHRAESHTGLELEHLLTLTFMSDLSATFSRDILLRRYF